LLLNCQPRYTKASRIFLIIYFIFLSVRKYRGLKELLGFVENKLPDPLMTKKAFIINWIHYFFVVIVELYNIFVF
jgi:hypothetical protein